jgi:hypothetical protein
VSPGELRVAFFLQIFVIVAACRASGWVMGRLFDQPQMPRARHGEPSPKKGGSSHAGAISHPIHRPCVPVAKGTPMTEPSKSSEEPAEGSNDIPEPREGSPAPAREGDRAGKDREGAAPAGRAGR